MYPGQDMRRLLGERQPSPSRAFARSSPSRLEKTRLASRHPGSNPQPVYGGGSWNFAGLGSSGFVDHGYSESNVYSNPYGEDTRGQRAQTPISVSSGSWPQDDFPRPPVQVLSKRVRRMSSLDMEALPNKRHQSYQSPARPARPIQTVNGQVFIDELEEPNQEINGVRIYSSDEYYLSGRMVTRGAVNPHCGSSPQKTVFGNEGAFQMSPPADRQRFLSESDRQRFTRGRSVQPSLRHYITPDHHSLPRSPQQSTGFQNRYQMSPPERSRRQKLSGYAQRYVGPYYIPDQRDFRRVQSEAPTSFRNPPHGRSNGQINSPNGHSGPPAQQQLQLGSPISWKEPLGAGMSITDNFIPTPKIKGHYAVNLNGNQNLPFEPRGRSKSVAPHTLHNPHRPVNQRRRSKSRPPGAQVNQTVTRRSRSIVPETPRFKTLRTTPGVRSYQEIDDEDVYMEDNDGTPMEQLFRKPRLDWLASRTNLENCPFRAAKVLPKESISYNDRSKLEAVKSWTKNVKHSFGKPSPVYINLLSPPESSVKVPPVRRSVPMKDRIAPAKKKETPTFNKKRKPTAEKEKAEAEAAAEDARQQRAADTIVDTEIKAVIKDLFGEISSQGRDKEKGRLEAQRKCEERELRLRKDEAAKLLDLEKKRLREEVEEKERREKEIEDARKKAKREAERKRSDAAEEAVRDEKRKMAQEKIEADRAEEAAKNIAEAADSERKKLLALTVQADPAELAKLKAKQDVAKQQAAALSTGNLFAIEEAKNATARASSPPQTSLRNFNPTMEDDAEMEDNSLFVPEYPPQSYSGNITNGSNYVPANTISKAGSPEEETAYGVDESRRQRTKCAGPSSAAEVFAQASSSKWPGREGYLAGRAAYEAKIEAERSEKAAAAAKAKLEARWKSKSVERTQSEQIQERPAPKKTAPAREKVKGDQALKKSHPAPKSKAKPKSAEPRAESTPEVEQSLRPGAGQTPPGLAISLPASDSLITPASTVINKAATSSGSTLVGMRILDPPKLGPLHPNQNDPKSGIKVISDLKRQRFDNAQTQRQSQQKKSTKERTENQKEEAVSKRANRAREKEKMRLIEEARTNCVELSGEELDEHLEVFMARRASICQKLAEAKARKQTNQVSEQDNLTVQWEAQQAQQSPEAPEYNDSEDDDDPETARRKANERATEESLNALRRQNSGQYHRHASQKTVADLHFLSVEPEESEESEEDPDDEPNMLQYIRGSKPRNPSVVLEPVATRASSTQTKQNASQDQDREVKTTHDLNPDDYGMQIVDPLADMSSSFGGYATVARSSHVAGPRTRSQSRPRQQPPNAPDMSIKNHTTKPGEIIRVYMVSKIDNDDELQFIGEIFSDRDEANHFAELQVQEYRKKRTKPSSIKEEYSEGLYTGIVAHGGRGGTTTISVSSQIKQTTNLPDVTHIQPRLPERSYLIIRTIKNSVFDSENSSTTVTVTSEPLEGMHFSDREYANNEAAKHLTQFLKPKKPNLDHIESYDNQVCPQIRDLLKSCDEAGNCFIIEVEKGDGGPPWLDVDSVEVEVKLFHMKGP